jgi:ATP-dependent exoDNAse (exonuclease V) beta subunit
VDGVSDFTSVTTFNHSHFGHFDADAIIAKMRQGKNWLKSKYYGMTDDEIKASWEANRDEAARLGTEMHESIELYYNESEIPNDSIDYEYFKNFEKDRLASFGKDLIPYRTEWMVWAKDIKLSGSIDMVYKNTKTGHLEIYDWKRSKEITKNSFGKYAHTELISHIPDSNYWHYSLQLNTYKYILENYYGEKVDALYLVCLHPNNKNKNYQRIKVLDLQDDVRKLLMDRKSNL